MDGKTILDSRIGVSLKQTRGRGWRLDDEEQSENIAMDPVNRYNIMQGLAQNSNDVELSRMMEQNARGGAPAVQVERGREWDVDGGWEASNLR
jgi:hypothetical protein